jgi:hypothetical protein
MPQNWGHAARKKQVVLRLFFMSPLHRLDGLDGNLLVVPVRADADPVLPSLRGRTIGVLSSLLAGHYFV